MNREKPENFDQSKTKTEAEWKAEAAVLPPPENLPSSENPENSETPEKPPEPENEEIIELEEENVLQEKLKSPVELFSPNEVYEINRIPYYDLRAQRVESLARMFSGKERAELEAGVADFRKREEELLELTVDAIKKSPDDDLRSITGFLDPEDLKVIRRYEAAGKPLVTGDEHETWRLNIALTKRRTFTSYLENRLKIFEDAGNAIYDRLVSEMAGEALEKEKQPEKRPEIKPPYEYFDPVEDLEKINKFTVEEMRDLSPEQRIKLKRERLNAYKKNLAEQMSGIAQANALLESIAVDKDTFSVRSVERLLEHMAMEYKFSPAELEKYRYALGNLDSRAQVIEATAAKLEGRTDKEKFAAIFGFEPAGAVEIKKNALSFFVVCRDVRDYARLYTGGESVENLEKVRSVGGHAGGYNIAMKELRGAITAANAEHMTKTDVESIRIHEEKHIVNALVRDLEHLREFASLGGRNVQIVAERAGLEEAFKYDRVRNERRAKDEVLAYIKDGRPMGSIADTLLRKESEGGLYDYFEKDRKMSIYKHVKKNMFEEVRAETISKYEKDVLKALDLAGRLEKMGFPRGQIIGLFQTEKMDDWGKVFERLKQSEQFWVGKQETIKAFDESLKIYGDGLIISQEKLREELSRPKIVRAAEKLWLKFRNANVKVQKKSNEELIRDEIERLQHAYDETARKRKEYEEM